LKTEMQRLTERLKNRSQELRELVEEQDAAMRERAGMSPE